MKSIAIPKAFLIHNMIYEEHNGKNNWDQVQYKPPITVNHVRHDEAAVYSKDTTERKELASGVIFVDGVNSYPVPNFKNESRITVYDSIIEGQLVNSKTMIIVKVIPFYNPTNNSIHHYELEVV